MDDEFPIMDEGVLELSNFNPDIMVNRFDLLIRLSREWNHEYNETDPMNNLLHEAAELVIDSIKKGMEQQSQPTGGNGNVTNLH